MSNAILEQLKSATYAYQMPLTGIELLVATRPLIVAGVTAAGKNVVMNKIIASGQYAHVVTHTTRPMRTKESNGVEHWFVDDSEMLSYVLNKLFIEVQLIHGDYCYGTSVAALQAVVSAGKKPIMELNTEGIDTVTKAVPMLRPIFILPPSYEIWMERLGTRDQMSDGEKERRLHSAKLEIESALRNRSYSFVINLEADSTATHILSGHDMSDMAQHEARKLAEQLYEYLQVL